jgi:hypothetical protein
MGTDPRLGIPYPEGTDANDVPRDIKAVVDKIGPIMAVDLQGTLSQRPAAGIRGRYYWATDKKALYRDDGAAWQAIHQPWADYSPNVEPIDTNGTGSGWLAPVVAAIYRARYRIDGPTCRVSFSADIHFSTGGGYEYAVSLPVGAKYAGLLGPAVCQNVGGFAITIRDDSVIGHSDMNYQYVAMRKYNVSNFAVPSVNANERFDIEYEIA